MRFWLITAIRYLLGVFMAILVSIPVSLFSILPWVKGDSPVYGLLWGFVFVVEAIVLTSLGIALTGELVERKVQSRHFRWALVSKRFFLALLMQIGPVFSFYVWGIAPSRRPQHKLGLEILAYGMSALFAYYALRIKLKSQTERGSASFAFPL